LASYVGPGFNLALTLVSTATPDGFLASSRDPSNSRRSVIAVLARSGFITYPAFDKLRPNGRKTVRGDAEPVEASNHEPAVMKLLLVIQAVGCAAPP